jgi:hypothetical protein
MIIGVYVRSESVTRKHLAARVVVTGTASFAALLFSNAMAFAEPPPPTPVPQEPGTTNNAAAEEQPREDQPAENANCPMCDLVKAAQQLPPPDFSGADLPPLADVSVPVSFGLGLPDLVPDIGFPIRLGAPQLPPMPNFQPPPAPKFELPPPPKLGPPKLPF